MPIRPNCRRKRIAFRHFTLTGNPQNLTLQRGKILRGISILSIAGGYVEVAVRTELDAASVMIVGSENTFKDHLLV